MVYKQWCSEWLNCYVKSQVKERTYEKYCHLAKAHILPELGEYHLNELSTAVLQQFVNTKESLKTLSSLLTNQSISVCF